MYKKKQVTSNFTIEQKETYIENLLNQVAFEVFKTVFHYLSHPTYLYSECQIDIDFMQIVKIESPENQLSFEDQLFLQLNKEEFIETVFSFFDTFGGYIKLNKKLKYHIEMLDLKEFAKNFKMEIDYTKLICKFALDKDTIYYNDLFQKRSFYTMLNSRNLMPLFSSGRGIDDEFDDDEDMP